MRWPGRLRMGSPFALCRRKGRALTPAWMPSRCEFGRDLLKTPCRPSFARSLACSRCEIEGVNSPCAADNRETAQCVGLKGRESALHWLSLYSSLSSSSSLSPTSLLYIPKHANIYTNILKLPLTPSLTPFPPQSPLFLPPSLPCYHPHARSLPTLSFNLIRNLQYIFSSLGIRKASFFSSAVLQKGVGEI